MSIEKMRAWYKANQADVTIEGVNPSMDQIRVSVSDSGKAKGYPAESHVVTQSFWGRVVPDATEVLKMERAAAATEGEEDG